MTARCSACGADLPQEAVICSQCGQAVAMHAASSLAPPETVDPQAGGSLSLSAASPPHDSEFHDGPPLASQDVKLWEGGYSAKAMLGGWLLAALVTVVATATAIPLLGSDRGLFLGLLCATLCLGGIGLYVMYWKLSVRYTLTSHEFFHRVGLFGYVTDRIAMIDVDDVAYSQGPFERLMGVGTIKIMSNDRSQPDLFLYGIDRVVHVAGLIDDACRAERRRRGLFIDAAN
ncbi:MAG: PH domain-containing protein [Pirellulaceae bacterium]